MPSPRVNLTRFKREFASTTTPIIERLSAAPVASSSGTYAAPKCFVGFWLICFTLLAALPVYFDLSQPALSGRQDWYIYVAVSVPVVLAVLLRKIIPTMMRWVFFAALAAFVIGLIVKVVQSR